MNAAVSTVTELHAKTLEWSLSCWKLHQLEDDFLVWAEHATLGNEMAQESTNLSGSTSDSNSDWVGFKILWLNWEVAAELGNAIGEGCAIHLFCFLSDYNKLYNG